MSILLITAAAIVAFNAIVAVFYYGIDWLLNRWK